MRKSNRLGPHSPPGQSASRLQTAPAAEPPTQLAALHAPLPQSASAVHGRASSSPPWHWRKADCAGRSARRYRARRPSRTARGGSARSDPSADRTPAAARRSAHRNEKGVARHAQRRAAAVGQRIDRRRDAQQARRRRRVHAGGVGRLRRRMPLQSIGMRMLPAASMVKRRSVARAVQSEVGSTHSAWESFANGSAVNDAKVTFGVLPRSRRSHTARPRSNQTVGRRAARRRRQDAGHRRAGAREHNPHRAGQRVAVVGRADDSVRVGKAEAQPRDAIVRCQLDVVRGRRQAGRRYAGLRAYIEAQRRAVSRQDDQMARAGRRREDQAYDNVVTARSKARRRRIAERAQPQLDEIPRARKRPVDAAARAAERVGRPGNLIAARRRYTRCERGRNRQNEQKTREAEHSSNLAENNAFDHRFWLTRGLLSKGRAKPHGLRDTVVGGGPRRLPSLLRTWWRRSS